MKTIAEQLIQLNQIKSDINQAINDKGVEVTSTDGFSIYPDKIRQIKTASDLTFDTTPTENSTNPVTSGGLYKVITENEQVTAAALNDLKNKTQTIESDIATIDKVTASSLNDLNDRMLEAEGTLSEMDEYVSDLGEVTSASLNDLNDRLLDVTDNKEDKSNKVTSISSSSTNSQYPSAKVVYDEIYPAIITYQPAEGFISNVLYNLGTISSNTTFSLATPSDANVMNHYYWTFETDSTAPTITWPSGLTWPGGSPPAILPNKHYEISVLNNIVAWMEV